jgi:hypothetical protein
MLDQLLGNPAYQTLVDYLSRPETGVAVLLPGLLSAAILAYYTRAGKVSRRLQLLWVLTLGVTYYCARWELTSDTVQLYLFSAFSVACLLLLFRRVYVSPALAYALTFLSLWLVDMTCALLRTLEYGAPISGFYVGVGAAGMRDALFLLPLLTIAGVAYAAGRIWARGERLVAL